MQLTELVIRRFSPLLHRVLGLYIPLVASNCAVLGVALINSTASRSFIAALFYGAGAALGFGLALVLLAGLRERLQPTCRRVSRRGDRVRDGRYPVAGVPGFHGLRQALCSRSRHPRRVLLRR